MEIPGIPAFGAIAQRKITRSVMSSMLILCAIALPALGTMMYFTTGHIQEILTYLVALIVVVTIFFFSYFALREPDRLQSEDYRTEMRRMDMIGEPGKQNAMIDLQVEQTPNLIVESQQEVDADGR